MEISDACRAPLRVDSTGRDCAQRDAERPPSAANADLEFVLNGRYMRWEEVWRLSILRPTSKVTSPGHELVSFGLVV